MAPFSLPELIFQALAQGKPLFGICEVVLLLSIPLIALLCLPISPKRAYCQPEKSPDMLISTFLFIYSDILMGLLLANH
jgi:hypothetical protein